MFGKSITLFTIAGFSIRIDLSWLLILALVVWSLSAGVFPRMYEDLPSWVYWLMGAAAALGLFASIVFHELCHSLVARRYGIPMTGITLFLFGGAAEMSDEPPSPKAELLMALAGPAASVVVCAAFLLIAAGGAVGAWPEELVGVIRWIGFINGVLVVFNLLPAFPLDGGRALRSILWHLKGNLRQATHTASRVGAAFGAALMVLGFLELLMLQAIGGLWLILIGLFIRAAARQGYQQVLVRQALEGERVERFMNDQPVTVPAETTVADWVENYVYEHHFKMFPVVRDGQLAGCVTTQQAKDLPRGQWGQTAVEELAKACSEENTIEPDADAIEAFRRMNQKDASRLMVVRDGQLVGIIALKDLLKFLSLKLDLEGQQDSASGLGRGGPLARADETN